MARHRSNPLLAVFLGPLLVFGFAFEGASKPVRTAVCDNGKASLSWADLDDRPLPRHASPNVLLVLADDLGWRDVGFHGGAVETPRIDNLADEGVELTRFYTHSVCTPTRAAIMTGRSPNRFGLERNVDKGWNPQGLPDEEHSLAEMFRDAGYETLMVGKWHVGHANLEYHPNAQGFDRFFGCITGRHEYYLHTYEGGNDLQEDGIPVVGESRYATYLFAEKAIQYIRERDAARPFFLYLPFTAPHTPNQAPPELVAKYQQVFAQTNRIVHAAMVEALDTGIGMVLDELARQNVLDDTIVVFLSDNGGDVTYGAVNAPLAGEKATTYEGGIHVPALIRFPSVLPAGELRHQLMADVDLLPTLAAAAGIETASPNPLDGRNYWNQLVSGEIELHAPILTSFDGRSHEWRAAVMDGWKLVLHRAPSQRPNWPLKRFYSFASNILNENAAANELVQEPALANALLAMISAFDSEYPTDGIRYAPRPAGWIGPADWTELMEGGDADDDGVDSLCDNCPTVANANQFDPNRDGRGAACAEADFDLSGSVGCEDLQLLRDSLGSRAGDLAYRAPADMDGDGVVGAFDFALFRRSASGHLRCSR